MNFEYLGIENIIKRGEKSNMKGSYIVSLEICLVWVSFSKCESNHCSLQKMYLYV